MRKRGKENKDYAKMWNDLRQWLLERLWSAEQTEVAFGHTIGSTAGGIEEAGMQMDVLENPPHSEFKFRGGGH